MYIVDPQKIEELFQDVKFMMVPPCSPIISSCPTFPFFWGGLAMTLKIDGRRGPSS
jgi:hypothetical protein